MCGSSFRHAAKRVRRFERSLLLEVELNRLPSRVVSINRGEEAQSQRERVWRVRRKAVCGVAGWGYG